ncbi:excalibur calcium-binding domain-containing protein [Paenibacillus sp. SC116]|uniref:excalibur calcium-binding domain-containing protein n=1 Tax=Paenibacillus sp. SC116 TaxID=2968986 RepID=UPI00215AAA88|nr:excalibur calcium-binding domain-containing protein [Paenibacillus sp. SC116]MCR8843613.1 excalibur calcium-binding domain-containing protein [Paenibacillus sp. SC116]
MNKPMFKRWSISLALVLAVGMFGTTAGTSIAKPISASEQIDVQAVAKSKSGKKSKSKPKAGSSSKSKQKPKSKSKKVKPKQEQETVFYKNCTAARNAGAAPLYEGEPGYRVKLDRDKDGVACE